MEIQSAFNSGVQGFQRANENANQAAANIAENAQSYEARAIEQQEPAAEEQTEGRNEQGSSTAVTTGRSLPDLNQSVVDLKVAEFQAKASTEVIKSADESLGTLLDVTV